MSTLNTAMRFLPDARPEGSIEELTRTFRKKDNADFLTEVARRLAQLQTEAPDAFDPGAVACIGLAGMYGHVGYGLRRAQEVVRIDMAPSYWSHAFLLTSALGDTADKNRTPDQSAWIWECSLEPGAVSTFFHLRNGVCPRPLADYTRADFSLSAMSVPNLAILAVELSASERKQILERANQPDVDQVHYNLASLLGDWYDYLTNRATEPNPLGNGKAIPSASYVQLAYDAVGIDLAPGAMQRTLTPEHLWQAFRYFQPTFRKEDAQSKALVPRRMAGWYVVRDPACVLYPTELKKLPRSITELIAACEREKRREGG